ncbi:MAG TPA: hypothetical protein VMF65_07930 [Acidimicrobiales bacterium]|nr:hypothetical protein [Acidimicrobiales bacterium]
MKNDGSLVHQASWSLRWATRAVDALALWGAIKSSAVDTMPMSDYVTPGSVDEPWRGRLLRLFVVRRDR